MSENTKVMIVIIVGVCLLGVTLFMPDTLEAMMTKMGNIFNF